MTAADQAPAAPDPHDPDQMLTFARAALGQWRAAKSLSAAEWRAARRVAWSLGRLDALASAGQLPADWRAALLANYSPGG